MMAITKRLVDCFLTNNRHCIHIETAGRRDMVFFGVPGGRFVIELELLGESMEYVMTVCGLNEDDVCPRFNQRIVINDVNEGLLHLIKYSCGIN